jgi:O-antigen/teichoic acid export membrane protein
VINSSLISHIKNYLGISIVSKFLSFAVLIIYSGLMTVEDYGVLSLYLSYVWIFVVVLSGNIYTSIGRYIYEENSNFSSFLTDAIALILIVFVCLALVIIVNIANISFLLKIPSTGVYVLIFVALSMIFESIFFQISIWQEKSGLLFKVLLIKTVFIIAMTFLLLSLFSKEKYLAVMFSELVGGVLLLIFIFLNIKKYFQPSYSKENFLYMARYSLPLIPYMLGVALLSQSDRLMIEYFFSTHETGLYSLSYNIGIVLVVVVNALLNAWNPSYFNYMNNKKYTEVEKGSELIFSISVILTIFLILFGENVFKMLVVDAYHDSLDMIPIVALGGLSFTIWQVWGRVIGYARKTYITSILTICAVVLNIYLNYTLLPLYGYKIAAWTTFVSYFFMGIIGILISNKFIKLYRVQIVKKLLIMILATLVVILFSTTEFSFQMELLLKFFVLFIFILFFWKPIKNIHLQSS